MTDFGVTPEGFVLKTLADVISEMEADEREAFGLEVETGADGPLGQFNGILGSQIADAWKVLQAVYRALYPDSAGGEALDNVLTFTGAARLDAEKSTATVFLHLEAAGDVVAAGSLIGVGANGAQFATVADVGGETFDSLTPVDVESSDTGPIEAAAGALDSIVTPVTGWVAKAAIIGHGGVNVAPYALEDGQTLLLSVDGEPEQTVIFDTGDFADITAATAQEVVDSINDQTTGLTASVVTLLTDTWVRIVSDTSGTGSSMQCTGGTANPELGFTRELHKGFNWDRVPQMRTDDGPYVLTDGMTLGLSIDGGSEQVITFSTSDFVAIGAATALEVAIAISAQLTGGYALREGRAVAIESDTTGIVGSIEVTDGTSLTALGLTLLQSEVGIDGAAELGTDLETDAAARARREQAVHVPTAGPLDALRAKLLTVQGVREVQILENPTHAVDVNGLPPNSFETVVLGGDETEIAQAIFDAKPLGIETYRDPGPLGVTIAIADSQGETHDVNFTRPDVIEMYVSVTVSTTDAFGGGNEETGKDAVRDAIKALGDSLIEGDDVIVLKFSAAVIGVEGVTDVTELLIDDVDPPTNATNFPVTARAIARFALSRIDVTVE